MKIDYVKLLNMICLVLICQVFTPSQFAQAQDQPQLNSGNQYNNYNNFTNPNPSNNQNGGYDNSVNGNTNSGQNANNPLNSLKNIFTPNPNSIPNQAPLSVPALTFVDVSNGQFGKLEINLEAARFQDTAVENLHLLATNFDITAGKLSSLDIGIIGGHVQDFIFDRLNLSNNNEMFFNTNDFLTQKTLTFTSPVQANVYAEISQKSLNSFLNAPNTLNRLSATATGKVAMIANMFGVNSNNLGFSVMSASANLAKNNQLKLNLDTRLGLGQNTASVPVEASTVINLANGWVSLEDTHLITAGQELPAAIANMLVSRINNLTKFNDTSKDISFQFTKLTVQPNRKFLLSGMATINKLRFGKN